MDLYPVSHGLKLGNRSGPVLSTFFLFRGQFVFSGHTVERTVSDHQKGQDLLVASRRLLLTSGFKTSLDKTLLVLYNSSYHAQSHSVIVK